MALLPCQILRELPQTEMHFVHRGTVFVFSIAPWPCFIQIVLWNKYQHHNFCSPPSQLNKKPKIKEF